MCLCIIIVSLPYELKHLEVTIVAICHFINTMEMNLIITFLSLVLCNTIFSPGTFVKQK